MTKLLLRGFLLAALAGGCTSGGEEPPPDALVVAVRDLGALSHPANVLGRDGGYGGVFEGRAVWLYSDTFTAYPDARGRTLVSNTWAWTADLDARDGIGGFREVVDAHGAPATFLAETAVERAYNDAHAGNACADPCGARFALWTAALAADPARGRALVFYSVVHALPGEFNFARVGSAVAVWPRFDAPPERPALDPAAPHADLLFGADEPPFGSAALTRGDMLYVYGCRLEGLRKPCRLGRVPPAAVHDRAAWAFYAGDGRWSTRLDDATALFDGNDILSVAWNAHVGRYVAIYSVPFSNRVVLRTAQEPEGPWSGEAFVFNATPPAREGTVYDALARPEYDIDGGRVFHVTYSRSTAAAFTSEVRLVAIEVR